MNYTYSIGKRPRDLVSYKAYLRDVFVDLTDVVVRDSGDIVISFPMVIGAGDKAILDQLVAGYGDYEKIDSPAEVKIREEWVKTGGNYRIEGLSMTGCTGGGAITVGSFSWAYPINILGLKLSVREVNNGDVVNGWVIPSGSIGITTTGVSTGQTIIGVSASGLEFLYVGYELVVIANGQSVRLGELIRVDKAAETITLVNAVPEGVDIAAGAGVSFRRCVARNVKLYADVGMTIGDLAVGTSYLPAGVDMVVEYKNNHTEGVTVDFDFNVEYFY